MNLSEHFTQDEFEYSDTARAKGINNKMNEAQIKEAKHTCIYMLEPVRKLLNETYKTYNGKAVKCVTMRITSGFRSEALNKVIPGASKTSAHSKACAADVEATIKFNDGTKRIIPYTELYSLLKKAVRSGKIVVDQLIQEKSGSDTWVHLGFKPQIRDCRKQCLIYKNGVYTLDTEN